MQVQQQSLGEQHRWMKETDDEKEPTHSYTYQINMTVANYEVNL